MLSPPAGATADGRCPRQPRACALAVVCCSGRNSGGSRSLGTWGLFCSSVWVCVHVCAVLGVIPCGWEGSLCDSFSEVVASVWTMEWRLPPCCFRFAWKGLTPYTPTPCPISLLAVRCLCGAALGCGDVWCDTACVVRQWPIAVAAADPLALHFCSIAKEEWPCLRLSMNSRLWFGAGSAEQSFSTCKAPIACNKPVAT